MKETLLTIILFVTMIVIVTWSVIQAIELIKEIIPEPAPYKSQTELNAERRDECLANGFDYEFVDTFWYIGVRCKK
jgi:hypothetical protein